MVCARICVYAFIKLHMTARSGPVVLLMLCSARIGPSKGQGVCVCVFIELHITAQSGPVILPSSMLPLIFLARRIQPFLSLVDRDVEFCVLTI